MKGKFSVLTFLITLFVTGSLNAQSIDSLMNVYNSKVPQEKIHIHFDNSLYLPGQTIWYKAYLLKDNDPSEYSKNFYMDWFDEKGKLLNRTIEPVVGFTATGSFTVPEKYTGTNIRVLAYTKWMLNFDSGFLFKQILSVAQPEAGKMSSTAIVPVTDLQFFPEGGDLVENISTTIAFKSINTAGMPVTIRGIITKSNKEKVAEFFTEHDGMGKLLFTPLPGETYTAEWEDPQGNIRYTLLPKAKTSGLVFSVRIKNESGVKSFTIERSPLLEDRFKRVSIVATMQQHVLFRAGAGLADKTKITASLPTLGFPSGVLQLTVFDNNHQPVAERILFVNNEEYKTEADIHIDTLNLNNRAKNVYEIEVADSLPASLSLAVTDGEGVYDSSRNIISNLLLSSEIKGYVHEPSYYFSSDEDSVLRHLDLVMLTNGWRRFAWDDVTTGKTPMLKYQRDSTYLSIAGKIDKLSEAKIRKAELVNMMIVGKDSSVHFMFAPLQADGSFREDNIILFDTAKVFYKLNKVFIPMRSHVNINNNFLSVDTTKKLPSLARYLPDTTGMARIQAIKNEQKRVEELMKQTTLKEVIVTAKAKTRIQEMDERYASGVFSGSFARPFNIVDDPLGSSYQSAFAYLESKVAGLQINNVNSFNPSATRRGSPVTLFLDEFHVDGATLASIPMTDVAYIKVFDPPFMGASGNGPGGAIAVYTKRGGDAINNVSGMDYTLVPGYTPVKQFYSPNYAEQQINFNQTDLRRTLYWKPNILTDRKNNKVKISFYNNDISHSLQLVLEGMTTEGKLIHISKLLK